MSISDGFKKRIRELVAETDKTTSELTKLMGIDNRPFSHAVQYGIIPSTRTLIRIADYFQVSIDYLLDKTDNETFYPSKNKTDFSSRITELCLKHNVTFYEVAVKCHFEKSYVSRWVRLNTLPTIELLELVVDYFSVSMDYILGRTDE